MNFKWFNGLVLGVVATGTFLCVAINYKINTFGVFGDVKGRSYSVSGSERTAKYLFSFNYIPSNFDGILIGSSISDNWNTSSLHMGHVYNASISGGNISEEGLILENVLKRGSLKNVLFVIHPYLTESFGCKSGQMNPSDYWSTLGSVLLFNAYIEKAFSRGEPLTTPYGQFRFPDPKAPLAALKGMSEVTSGFPVDERAMAVYGDLLRKARQSGARVIGVIPLIYLPELRSKSQAYASYQARVRALFLAGELVIDLNQQKELESTQANSTNFPDGVHYTTATAEKVSLALDRALRANSL